MNAPLPDNIAVSVPEEVETQILHELGQEMAEEIYREIDDAFPNYVISPAVQLPPRERLQKYLLRIVEAYPADETARLVELNNLLNPDFIDMYKAGVVPAPLSMPWAVVVHVPKIFKRLQTDFRQAYKAWAQKTVA